MFLGGFGGFGLGGKPVNDPTKNPFGSIPSTPQQQSGNSNFYWWPHPSLYESGFHFHGLVKLPTFRMNPGG